MAKEPRPKRRGRAGLPGVKTPAKCPEGVSVGRDEGPLPPPILSARGAIHAALLEWFARVGRELPWRSRRDPYATWVSEVMLQQTQVERVVGYFLRFMERFPTVARLAAAPEADVLRAWEGLGYYRRARQLHAAAARIVAEHDGRVPGTPSELRGLPGIGRYTAGAIASIAFDRREPIVEANSRRVLARLVAHAAPLAGAAGDGPIWEIATALLPERRVGLWNQALMDLGATVCTPRRPLCSRCPLAEECLALATGRVESIPAAAPRRKAIDLKETAVVVRRAGKVLVVRRGAGEWWEGLWDFPRLSAGELLAPLGCGRRRVVGRCAYTVTHHRVAVTVSVCEATHPGPRLPGVKWVEWGRLGALAMTAPGRRIAAVAGPGDARRPRRADGASARRRR